MWWITSLLLLSGFSLCLSLSSRSLIIMCFGVGHFEHLLLGVYWASWMFIVMYFIKLGKVSGVIFSNTFSSPAEALPMHILLSLLISHRSPKLCTQFLQSFFFQFLRLNNSHCPIFKFMDSFFFTSSNLSLNPSSRFFISVVVIFSSWITFSFFYSFSLLTFPFCSYFIFKIFHIFL